jgi:hypothetical protein
MVRASLTKAVLLLVLTLLLVAPIQAAGSQPADSAAKGILAQVWDFLTGVWARNGCDIDPSGRCVSRPSPTSEIDNGCNIDPDGRCAR